MPNINGEFISTSYIIGQYGINAYNMGVETGQWPPQLVAETKAAQEQKRKESIDVATTPLDAKDGFTFGADPELFVFNKTIDKFVTAEGLIPGTKSKPHEVKDGAVQVDGMAAEFNIKPAKTFKEFNHNIESVMKQLTAMLPPEHELRAVPSVTFDEEIFNAAPDCAKELGCSPDFNAWSGQVNPPPKDDTNPFLRTASGHIHIGWTEDADLSDPQHVLNCRDLVKQLDWYLGGWSLKVDTDPARRRLYGKAGALRFKDYGVEYRVLSNFWITSRERRLAVWNRLQKAIDTMSRGFLPDRAGGFNDILRQSIDSSNLDPNLLTSYKYPLTSLIETVPSGRGRVVKSAPGKQFYA